MRRRIPEDRATDEVTKLYRAEASSLFNRALVLTQGDRQAAEDLVQEVFKAAFEKWRSVGRKGDEDRRRWLFVVLQRKAIDRWRADRRMLLAPELLDTAMSTQMADDETAIQALSSVVIDQAWQEMKIMPAAQYRVAYLAWRCGRTDREIAKILGIARNTVRVHRHNAAHQLRNLILPLMDPRADDVQREEGNDEGGR